MTRSPDPVAANPAGLTTVAPSGPARNALFDLIARRPDAAFGGFLVLHFVVWTVLPTLLYANLPLDLIEALTYGHQWQFGYDKLPPLPWWLVAIAHRVWATDASYYALAEIAVVVAFAAVWAMARPLVGAIGALVAVLIIDGVHYFQYTAVKFNHDVVQLPLWALAGLGYYRGLKGGRIGSWLLCGFAVGAALWAKYFVVVLAAPLALFLLLDRDARRSLRTPGPWLAIAAAFIVMAPHLVWLFQNDFLPFAYADARASPARGWYDHLWHPAFFAGGQLVALLPALLIAAPLIWPRATPSMSSRSQAAAADAFDRRIVTLLAFGPAAAMLALIAVSGRGAVTMWGYPLWIFVGLWIVVFAGAGAVDAARLRRVVLVWGGVFSALALAFILNYTLLPALDHRYRAAFFPGERLAAELTQRFHAATGGQKLRYVIGSMWIGGNVAHYSPDQPEVLIDGLPHRAPWIDLHDVRAKGALLVWQSDDLEHLPAAFAAVAPAAQVGVPLTLPVRRFGAGGQTFGWAILPPQ